MNEWLRTLLGLLVMLQGPTVMAMYNQGYTHGLSRYVMGFVAFLLILIGFGIHRGWGFREADSTEPVSR